MVKKIISLIIKIVGTKTITHFLITSVGTIINGLLGLAFYIVAARILEPVSYGILAVAIVTITLLADMADFGLDSAIIRFVGKYNLSDSVKAQQVLKLCWKIKTAVWLIILLIGWWLVPIVTEQIFLKTELIFPLRLALVGVGGAILFSLAAHALQAYQKYWLWVMLNISLNSLRLLAVGILFYYGVISVTAVLQIYILLPFLGFALAHLFLPAFWQVRREREMFSEVFHYSKWIAGIGFISALSSRLDTFISTRLLTIFEVGLYSAANQLAAAVLQLIFALATVIAPKLASFSSDKETIVYLKKVGVLVGLLAVGGLLVLPTFYWIVPAIFGQSYQKSIEPFMILFVAQLFLLLALPAHQAIFYYLGQPKFINFLSFAQLFSSAFLGWMLISAYGIIGAAVMILVVNIFNFVASTVWVICQFKKRQ